MPFAGLLIVLVTFSKRHQGTERIGARCCFSFRSAGGFKRDRG